MGAKFPLVFTCALAACVLALMSLVRHNTKADIALLCFAMLCGGLVEPILFSSCCAVVSTILDQTMNRSYKPKTKVVWASVVVNYGAATGCLIGPIIAGNARETLGWTGAC